MNIHMLKTEPVITPRGPVILQAGKDYSDLDEHVCSSLVGRGLAVENIEGEAGQVYDRTALEKMTVPTLKEIARQRNIEDYNLLNKARLIDILAPETSNLVDAPAVEAPSTISAEVDASPS